MQWKHLVSYRDSSIHSRKTTAAKSKILFESHHHLCKVCVIPRSRLLLLLVKNVSVCATRTAKKSWTSWLECGLRSVSTLRDFPIFSIPPSCPRGTSLVSWVDDDQPPVLIVLCCLTHISSPFPGVRHGWLTNAGRRRQTRKQGVRPTCMYVEHG